MAVTLLTKIRNGLRRATGVRRLPMEVPPHERAGFYVQSVDELISIMNRSWEQVSQGMSVSLSDSEAIGRYYGWQSAAAAALAESVMMAAWSVQVYEGEEKGWVDAPDHPLVRLKNFVNTFMTGEELDYYTVLECMFTGKSWWHVVLDGLDMPRELWPMIGAITPKVDASGDKPAAVTGWTQQVRGRKGYFDREYPANEVVYLRLPKPGDVFGGIGPAQQAGAAIKLMDQIVESEWAAFKQGIFPFAILSMTDVPDAKSRDAVVAEFTEKYSGAKSTGRAIGVNANAMKVEWPPTKARDMGYHQGTEDQRDAILGQMRVPAAVLGLSKDVNRSSVEGLTYIFAKYRVSPLLTLYQARQTQDLAERYYSTESVPVRIQYANVVPDDKAQVVAERDVNLRHGVSTINEVRAERGDDPVPWGDEPWMPLGLIQPGISRPEVPPSGEGQAAQLAAPKLVVVQARPAGLPPTVRRRLMARLGAERMDMERRLRKRVGKYFRGLGDDVLSAFEEAKGDFQGAAHPLTLSLPKGVDGVLEPSRIAADMSAALDSLHREGLVLGGQFDGSFMANPSAYPWGPQFEAIDRHVAQFGAQYYSTVAETTRARFKSIVAESLKGMEPYEALRDRLVAEIDHMTEARARAISVTETTDLYNEGGQAFREEYEIEWKQWFTSHVNSRETHIDADGQVVKNDEMFEVGNDRMMHPGGGSLAEENVNCFIDPKVLVLTDHGYRLIGDIQVGAMVLTHKGRFRRVLRTLEPKLYQGDIVRIQTGRWGLLKVTSEHPVETTTGWKVAMDVKAGDQLVALATQCAHCGKLIPQVRSGYQFAYCGRPCSNAANPDKAINARAACTRKYGSGGYLTHLTLAQRQKGQKVYAERYGDGDLATAVRRTCGAALGRASWHGSALEQSMARYLTEQKRQFERQFAVGCRRVDFYLPEEKLFVECDGAQFHQDAVKERARDVEILLQHPDHKIAHVTYGQNPPLWHIYDLAILNHAGAYQFTPVEVVAVSIKGLQQKRRLYNLAVEEDESYVAHGFVVHNCNCFSGHALSRES